MKTSVIEMHDLLSVLSVDEVEKRIAGVPGVESATVNYAAGNATVRYDETRLEITDIKVLVHQRGDQPAGESLPIHGSEHEPAGKPAVVPAPKAAPASASKPEAATPKTPTAATGDVPAMAAPKGDGQQDKTPPMAPPSKPEAALGAMAAPTVHAGDEKQSKTTPIAPPSATPAAPPKPSPVAPTANPSTPVAAASKAAPDAKSPTPKASAPKPDSEAKPDSWKVPALSLTVTMSVAYISCAIFDALLPPFGLLAALAPASPFPISGSPLAYLAGFALFTVLGFVFGALHGIAWKFWSKRLR